MSRKKGKNSMPQTAPKPASAEVGGMIQDVMDEKLNDFIAIIYNRGGKVEVDLAPDSSGRLVIRVTGYAKRPNATGEKGLHLVATGQKAASASAFRVGDPVRVNGGDAIIKEVIFSGAGEAPQYKLSDLQGLEFGPAKESELSRR